MQTASPAPSTAVTESSQFNPDRLSEAEVRTAVSIANVPALLMVVYQMTGDEKWLEEPYRPTRGKGLGDHDSGGLSDEIQDEIRQAAVQAILDFQSGVEPVIETPTAEQTVRMISVCMGEPVADQYGPMLSLELARRAAPNAPELALEPVTPPSDSTSS